MTPHLVAVIAYDGLCTFEFGCVVEIFALERPELQVDWYRVAVCAEGSRSVRAAGGVTVAVPHSLSILDRADTIVIPGWSDPDRAPSEALLRRIRAAHRRGARIASVCSGVFVLAAAGLLDGKSAATHWRYTQQLQRRFPAIQVQPDALYVDEGSIITSAGSAAGLDMMLHLVRKDHGARIANSVAQRLVVPLHRTGDQAQFIARPVPPDEAARLSRVIEWARNHLTKAHTLATLAKAAHMSERTLHRQFRESLGIAPMQWLIRERVHAARELLETTLRPVQRVAASVGFTSEESFRRHFRLTTGISPLAYRRQFNHQEPHRAKAVRAGAACRP
jgi:AraC family transcriptional regulator, transcriptional activator FtrA